MARVDAASAGVVNNVEPLMGAVSSIDLFGEPLSLTLLIGGALMILGSPIVARGEAAVPGAAGAS